MKNFKKGFTLVEVIVALSVIAVISAVAITVVSMSGNMLSEADNTVWASAEARNIVDCYTKSKISGADDFIDDFIGRVGVVHNVADMEGKYIHNSESETNEYKFYFDADYKLVDAPAADIAGGYLFRLEMKIDDGELESLTVKKYNANPSKEKSVYEFVNSQKGGE